MRTHDAVNGTTAFPIDLIMPYFQNIAMARVSTSGKEAVKLGHLRNSDRISINQDYLLTDAKQRVREMIAAGYRPPLKKSFPAFGQTAMALLKVGTRQMWQAGVISDHDWHIACRIIDILAGGSVIAGSPITEEYLLDLEREVFISLVGTQKSQDRIAHMLKTGKPLRN